MIREENGLFVLRTDHTQYVFYRRETGHLEHLYYGDRYDGSSPEAMCEKQAFLPGSAIGYSPEISALNLENLCLEMSAHGKGDLREPFLVVTTADGSRTRDFLYESHEITPGRDADPSGLPGSYGTADEVDTLAVILKDAASDLSLVLRYHVYAHCDVITRSAELVNGCTEPVRVSRFLSTQLDLPDGEYAMTTFTGAWAREMHRDTQQISGAKLVNSTVAGVSSNRCNPFFMIHGRDTGETHGDCFAFNLVYSGNHYSVAERNPYGKVRILSGINPEGFEWTLKPGERFRSPEAIMAFSSSGFSGISAAMHEFVRHHIVRGAWQWKERPILFNSWEASYFDIHESLLVRLAKKAKSLGIELFVLDDGWFGKRDGDTSSLGDWVENRKKLPAGLRGLSKKITALGLSFGIWVEPEMVNEDSDLYRSHPEWVVQVPGRPHSEGRNQRILDLANPEVQDFIITTMRRVFSSGEISYVKWDMNRVFSDWYSPHLAPEDQGGFLHRYVLGLYRVLETLTGEFPHILFEACASGGNRFDLGMLCYMPQIWASDNTDAVSRLDIQEGYSYGYPPSVMGAHVSGSPNHQTLRRTPAESRYHVATFGLLGYECNLLDFPAGRQDAIRNETERYKQWRSVFQFGALYRIPHYRVRVWMTVSADRKRAVMGIFQILVQANQPDLRIRGCGLDPAMRYRFYNIPAGVSIKEFGDLINTQAPVHIRDGSLVQDLAAKFYKLSGEQEEYLLTGDQIMKGGISLKQAFIGMGHTDEVRLFQDFASRLYYMEAVE